MKKLLLLVATVLVMVAPVFAADFAFKDVPSDHWAYDALAEISKTGVVEGFPDGNFYGKRNITRYEFAMAIASFYDEYLKCAAKDNINTSDWATKADIADFVKKEDLPDMSQFADAKALDALLKLADEFKAELEALGVNVNTLKSDVSMLKEKCAKIEAEQKRVQISGAFTFNAKFAKSGDTYLIDIDDRLAKNGSENKIFSSDFQLDIKGKVNNNINAYISLVSGNFLREYYNSNLWTTAANRSKFTVLPYYVYADMNYNKWGFAQLGRIPFQINKYVFRKTGGDSYSFVPRMKDGNFPVDGLNYTNDFGAVDAKLWFVRPQTDMYCDSNLWYNDATGIYNVNPLFSDTSYYYAYGFTTPINYMTGAQLGFDISTVRLEALYNHARAHQNFNSVAAKATKSNIYGAKLNIPIGSFGLNGAWYRQKTKDMHNYYKMNDNDNADLLDTNATFDYSGLHLGLNYKSVGAGYAAPGGAWDGFAYLNGLSNVKGWGADGKYDWGRFNILAAYKDLKVKNEEYDRVVNAGFADVTNKIKWYKAGIGYNTGSWGTFGLRYENINNRDWTKRNYTTLDWKKTFGKVDALIGFQWVNNKINDGTRTKNYADNKGTILYGSICYKF